MRALILMALFVVSACGRMGDLEPVSETNWLDLSENIEGDEP